MALGCMRGGADNPLGALKFLHPDMHTIPYGASRALDARHSVPLRGTAADING